MTRRFDSPISVPSNTKSLTYPLKMNIFPQYPQDSLLFYRYPLQTIRRAVKNIRRKPQASGTLRFDRPPVKFVMVVWSSLDPLGNAPW